MEELSLGKHILIEYYGCDAEVLNDRGRIRDLLVEAAQRSRATIVTDVFHQFSPHGVSGVVVIAESHVAIHTWPEHRCASVDIFSCSDTMSPSVIREFLGEQFKAQEISSVELKRGLIPAATKWKVELSDR